MKTVPSTVTMVTTRITAIMITATNHRRTLRGGRTRDRVRRSLLVIGR
jgi:hypothetical protein